MLRQQLSQRMLQKLSPQQIQLMKLLQIPTATLEQRIKEELEANPALEEGDEYEVITTEQQEYGDILQYAANEEAEANGENERDSEPDDLLNQEFEFEDYLTEYIEDDPASYKMHEDNYSGEEEERTIPIPVENTFHEFLEQQLGLIVLEDAREEAIAKQIIGSIDDDGYLRREPDAILDDLAFTQNISATRKEVLNILAKIQRFDPPGIGARDLRECLKLQLRAKMENGEARTPHELETMEVAFMIVDEYFEEFSKKHYPKMQRQLDLTEQELKEAIDEILKLNPKPASGYTPNVINTGKNYAHNYVVPDFIIVNRDGELELSLNSRNAPDLRINEHYKDMLRSYKDTVKSGKRSAKAEKEAVLFIKQKIDSAKWFIDAIRQRQETMFHTMHAIMDYQYEYFLTGDQKKLRPMILKDIADVTGLDISTVSRVANSKFVQTEFGTKRLKDFFSESLQTNEGEEVSTLEVKKILSDLISDENKRKPHSDEKLKNMLRKSGYNIARRTVAKYREQLNIPVARLRKEL
ncbi:MAG: RNA polymerase factor sigma-54 [Saprospiraceae bacterium]